MATISARMLAALMALFLCTLALAGSSWWMLEREKQAVETLYAEIVSQLSGLKLVSDRLAANIVDMAHKTRDGATSASEARVLVRNAIDDITRTWGPIRDREHAEAKAQLIRYVDTRLQRATRSAEKLAGILEKDDKAALDRFVLRELYPTIEPASEAIGTLLDKELEGGQFLVQQARDEAKLAQLALLGLAALTTLICIGTIAYVILGVVRPLRRSVGTMQALAEATVGARDSGTARMQRLADIAIDGAGRRDEIGEMARTLQTFKEAGLERQRLRSAAEAEQEAREARASRIEALIGEFEAAAMDVVASVTTASAELEASAKSMMEVAQTASEQSTLVAAASHQASQNVQSLAATGDELAVSIGEIGRQAEQSSVFAARAADKARATDETVARLNEAGRGIVEVIDLIKSIASQTNLLALNATIEAARAGEAGRGFAVVASEVKALAAQTTRATDVIGEHVVAIQAASAESIEAMGEITRMIEEINQVAASIAVAVTEQSQATQGIAENVQQVAQGTAHASESIAVVNQAADNTGIAAGQVLSASEELARQSQMMRDKVDWFLRAVRAA
ncbi:MAG: methyl-accepting chemotaxis protein [Hyphomicrobiales bacterium]|uniref:methyl-accepting chemotaxis protein n=1 Tax=Rhabdaerophilum calidifontis TaxID=2604328 RepID=UPI00123B8E19|nr:methyl-accepting chemotaxis protein [Rhabdaerophilum calidifontis]MCA1953058.1 methyl-accepting chemotaxis protein [Hyphomicrobiales bacterium]